MTTEQELKFKGIGVSPGIASGTVLWLEPGEQAVPDCAVSEEEIPREMQRLEDALLKTREQLHEIQARVNEAMGTESARIFEAHLNVVDDPSFISEVCSSVHQDHRNVEKVLKDVSERYVRTLLGMEDDYLRERAVDIRDVTRRILRNLSGGGGDFWAGLDSPRILMAHDVAPSELAMIDRNQILALVTELGSPTSHSAIMARAMGLPAIVGVFSLEGQIPDGAEVIVDGVRGFLLVNPTATRKQAYARIENERGQIQQRLAVLRKEPAVTLDAHRIMLSANIELPSDVDRVVECGAQGVGLYRSEFVYLSRADTPDEEEQFQAYAEVAKRLAPETVILRTLDLGGDKMPGSLKTSQEANPFMGWRAIRLCLGRPDLFKTQLRAILRASAFNPNLKIMYPMVSRIADVQDANAFLSECKAELRAEKKAFNAEIEVGVMIEIPSAALCAEWMAPLVDFFSIGTNDLVQYTLAVDRVNERVAHLYEPTHPAVLKLIRQTVDAGRRQGIWTGVCGEMAGNPILTPLLLGLGVQELSAVPMAVPLVKNVIRQMNLSEARALAEEALTLATGDEIMARCRRLVGRISPEILELAE
ncbi:MAG: phosphoenolpyruvate--protein phosphotransferase [Verrucomicrobiota bacterium]|jgi:phosphotransferase system enzyme I (PtsI)|nr:phosphoenolpyruvate--protein phosphotransferase [Verrucomicrobiota bacterium]